MKNLEQIYFVLINLFLIVVSTLFGLHQIDNQYFFTAFVFIVIALLDSINLYKNRQDIELGSTILVYLAMTFILILYFGVTENYIGAPWLFQVVLYSYSLLGLKKGIIACSIFFITLIGIHIGYFVLGVPFPYNMAFTFSYAIALLILSVGVFFYAFNVNQMVKKKIKNKYYL